MGKTKGGRSKDLIDVDLRRCIQKCAQIAIRDIRYNAAIYEAPTVCMSSLNPPPVPTVHYFSTTFILCVCLPNCCAPLACELLEAVDFVLLFIATSPDPGRQAGTNMGLENI